MTRRSLRRAVTLGDGWMPAGLRGADIVEMLAAVDVPDDFDVVLATRSLDILGDPAEALRQMRSLRDYGASAVTCMITAESVTHFCDPRWSMASRADVAAMIRSNAHQGSGASNSAGR